MDKRRCRHLLRWAALSLVIALSIPMSSPIRSPSVRADGPASLPEAAQPVAGGPLRRPRVKFSGWVGQTGVSFWRIGDRVLQLDPDSPPDANVQAGRYVTVIASVDDAGELHAESLLLQPPSGGLGYTMEFRCLIQEITLRYWIVCNRVVLITENTSIQGRPEIGAMAEVKGVRLTADAVLAKRIKVAVPGAFAEVEFEGAIESLAADVWMVNGITVVISPVTTIRGVPELGLLAEVKGVLQPDGSVLAITITTKGPGLTSQVDIEGLVEEIESTYWVVGGTKVFIDSSTFIDDSHAPAEVGMRAQIRALRRQDQTLLALRIRLSRPD